MRTVRPHSALPAAEIPALLEALADRQGVAARALEFIILTAVRAGEAIGARWDPKEFNLADRVWVIPASRTKGGSSTASRCRRRRIP